MRIRLASTARLFIGALWLPLAAALHAQQTGPFVLLGSVAEDRARMDQLRGLEHSAGWLVRTPSLMNAARPAGTALSVPRVCDLAVEAVPVAAVVTWNSDIPFARNDAGVWAGRGGTVAIASGARAQCGMFRLQVVPEVWHAQNADFPVLPSGNPNRSDFANPFHSTPQSSADLPLRLGTRPITAFQPGQTSFSVTAGPIVVGAGTESEWWGPGIRNALVMSNNAVGIPRYFLGTSRPVHTRAGAFSARWIAGVLAESQFYERQGRGQRRPLSGLVVTLAPAADSNLSIGAARVVQRRHIASTVRLEHAFDVITRWRVRREEGTNSADQLTSLFARWVFPASGLEAYAEWARTILPASLREFLIAPQHSQGYTLGLQWLGHARAVVNWRAQLELTNLEQVRPSRTEAPPTFYTSPIVFHGYTQRGRVIGAAIGPGSSSQWLAVDAVAARWSAGTFGGRIRWDHDEYSPRPSGLSILGHDVSLYGGLRATYRGRYLDYSGELVAEQRMNYLFQHALGGFGVDRTFDVHNLSLRMSVAPGGRAPTR